MIPARVLMRSVVSALSLATFLLIGAGSNAAFAAPKRARPLRVVATPIEPFVLPETDPPAGFSIDLWNELARRMEVEFTLTVLGSQPEALQAVERGDADVAIAAITMTSEREKALDLSHPYFDTGLQIMVRAQSEPALLTTLRAIPWPAIGHLFGAAFLIVFLLANVLWLVERRSGDGISRSYPRGIGEALWGTMLIIATGEHGDRNAPGVAKRVAVVVMWLVGVTLIAQLTATVTSSQTVHRLQSSIRGPEDLPGKAIASVRGTPAGDYLTERGLGFVGLGHGPDAIRMLVDGEVQAVVFDAPTLRYWAAKHGNGLVQVVGPVFRPEKYALAVARGSTLREPINEALLELDENGTYEDLHEKWFSPRK